MKTKFHLKFKFIAYILVLMLITNCTVYRSSTSLNTAANSTEKGFIKVTMLNGDEYIYEKVVTENELYYGVKTVAGEIVKTQLIQDEILKVQQQNKKSSSLLNIAGVGVGITSVILAIFMFN